jgi:hypothetical protein
MYSFQFTTVNLAVGNAMHVCVADIRLGSSIPPVSFDSPSSCRPAFDASIDLGTPASELHCPLNPPCRPFQARSVRSQSQQHLIAPALTAFIVHFRPDGDFG